jgi:hypothetical protein
VLVNTSRGLIKMKKGQHVSMRHSSSLEVADLLLLMHYFCVLLLISIFR